MSHIAEAADIVGKIGVAVAKAAIVLIAVLASAVVGLLILCGWLAWKAFA